MNNIRGGLTNVSAKTSSLLEMQTPTPPAQAIATRPPTGKLSPRENGEQAGLVASRIVPQLASIFGAPHIPGQTTPRSSGGDDASSPGPCISTTSPEVRGARQVAGDAVTRLCRRLTTTLSGRDSHSTPSAVAVSPSLKLSSQDVSKPADANGKENWVCCFLLLTSLH